MRGRNRVSSTRGPGERPLSNDSNAAPKLERSKIRRAALIFVVGSIVIMSVTLALTTDDETWRGVVSFGGWLVALLFVVSFLRMCLEALSVLILINGTRAGKINLLEALELTIESYFVTQLIPVTAAGVPYQAFLLTRKGVRAGWATAVVLVKGFVPGLFFFFVLVATVAVTALGLEVSDRIARFLRIVGPLAALPLAFIVTMVVIVIRYPSLFDRLVDRLGAFLKRKLPGKAAEKVEEALVLMEDESHIFRDALTTLGRQRRWVLVLGTLLIILAFLTEFMVAVVILWGFGYRGSMVGPLVLQCILKPVLAATPTPGSLAFGEGGYIAFFAAFLPASFVGVSLVLWRLVLYFVPMFVGGSLVAKRIGRGFVTGKAED